MNSTWAALRNPAFRKIWIAAVISGTCVAAHDSAATWMMNTLTGVVIIAVVDVDRGVGAFFSNDAAGWRSRR